jgi:hypothetical protein
MYCCIPAVLLSRGVSECVMCVCPDVLAASMLASAVRAGMFQCENAVWS